MEGMQQRGLFDDIAEPVLPQPKRRRGGSSNPIVFHDYESYVAKFQGKEKTTDDTFTPPDVFEAVVKYVGEVYDLSGKEILRPFYPGGDYENAEYPSGGGSDRQSAVFDVYEDMPIFLGKGDSVFYIRAGAHNSFVLQVLHGCDSCEQHNLRE